MEVSTLLLNFAVEEMNAQRDKANTQPQQNQQLAAQDEQRRRQEQVAQKRATQQYVGKKLSDLSFDIAKLVIAGVILTGIMHQDLDVWNLLLWGIIAVVLFVMLGIQLIRKFHLK